MMLIQGSWIYIFMTAVIAEVRNVVVVVQPSISSVNEGHNIDVNCSVKNKLNPQQPVFWKALGKKYTQPISENCHVNKHLHRTFNLSQCEHEDKEGNYVLHLRSARWNDSGVYECAHDGIVQRATVVVNTKIRDLMISHSLKGLKNSQREKDDIRTVYLPPGAVLYLNCTIGCAYPIPKVKWKVVTSVGYERQVPRANYSIRNEKCSSPPPIFVGRSIKQSRVTSILEIHGKNVTGTRHAKVERYSCIASNDATGAFTNSEFKVEYAGSELRASSHSPRQLGLWPLFVITVAMTTIAKLVL